jgi:hypothetical protein
MGAMTSRPGDDVSRIPSAPLMEFSIIWDDESAMTRRHQELFDD